MASPTLTTTPNTPRCMQNVSCCPRAAENPSQAVAPDSAQPPSTARSHPIAGPSAQCQQADQGWIMDLKCIGMDRAGTRGTGTTAGPAASRHSLRSSLQLGEKQHLPQARFNHTHAPRAAPQGKTCPLCQTASVPAASDQFHFLGNPPAQQTLFCALVPARLYF